MRRFLLFASMLTTLASAHPPTHPPAEAGPEAERFACVPVNGRQGQPGCWIIASMPVVATVGRPLFWHVYELPAETPAGMREAEGGRIVQAYGRTWLVTVADREWRPAAGRHVATVGPLLPLTSGPHLASFAEATFAPGMRSRIHTHPGPEAWVVLEGEQCLETPEGVIRVAAGQDMMVRGGIPMALFGTGTGTRRALVLVLHPADQPWGMPHTGWQPTGACLTP
jgi:quercetin dioxygenase-like cupin family protein